MDELTSLMGPLWILWAYFFGAAVFTVLSLAIMIRFWIMLGAATEYLKRKTFMLGVVGPK